MDANRAPRLPSRTIAIYDFSSHQLVVLSSKIIPKMQNLFLREKRLSKFSIAADSKAQLGRILGKPFKKQTTSPSLV